MSFSSCESAGISVSTEFMTLSCSVSVSGSQCCGRLNYRESLPAAVPSATASEVLPLDQRQREVCCSGFRSAETPEMHECEREEVARSR